MPNASPPDTSASDASAPDTLQHRLAALTAPDAPPFDPDDARAVVDALLDALNHGTLRAATPHPDGTWQTHAWIKAGLLLGFRIGRLAGSAAGPFSFVDKDTYPPRIFTPSDGVRVVPGGSTVRAGSYLAEGVVCMPPMYVNVGAYVDEGTMIDSHALVGSCAQIGRRVHLSAAAQVGGVLEPVGARPVIIEDDAFIGGGCGLYEGCLVRTGAVLAPGVILTGATRVYDLVQERVLARTEAAPLEIPAGAVVVPGSRTVGGAFARAHGLALYAPMIVKYRDGRTDAATTLEDALR